MAAGRGVDIRVVDWRESASAASRVKARGEPIRGTGDAMEKQTRRLAAVWFADIVGYSALSSRDEAAALRLLGIFKRVSEDTIAEHGGRLVQFIGDAVFAEFSSTDGAVRAALTLRARLARAWEDSGLSGQVRVGVHVGDVAFGQDGDLFGEGVNVAARLSDVAGPGQVLASQDVWRQLRQLRDLHFSPAGERQLKGIAVPVYAFAVDDADAADVPETPMESPSLASRLAVVTRAAALLGLAGAVILMAVEVFRESFGLGPGVYRASLALLVIGFGLTLRAAWVQSGPSWERPAGGPAPWELDLADLMRSVTHGHAPRLNWARVLVGGVMAFAAMFGSVGLWMWAREHSVVLFGPTEVGAAPDPALAVLPFDSSGGIWADGLPELLALAVDGVRGIRVVDPRVVQGRAQGLTSDSATAVRIGTSLNARFSAVGTFAVDATQATLSLDVFDVGTGALRHRAVASGSADAVPVLVEQIADEILAEALPDTQAHPWRIDAAITGSAPALLSYLRGMKELRRGNWPGALTEFDAALEADPGFSLARYRRAFVRGWSMPPHILMQDPDSRLAAARAHGLPERERLMVEGYYQTHYRFPEAITTLERLTTLYPDDPEGWFLLGDALYHLDPDRRVGGFGDAFRTVLQLSPDFGPAYPHLIEDALERADSAEVRALVAQYREAEPLSPLLPGLEWAVRITREFARDPNDDEPAPEISPEEEEFRAAARAADRARNDAVEGIHPDLRPRVASLDSLGAAAIGLADAGNYAAATGRLDLAREGFSALLRDSEVLRELDQLRAALETADPGEAQGPLWERGRALVAEGERQRDQGEYQEAIALLRRAEETFAIAVEEAQVAAPEPGRATDSEAAGETAQEPAGETTQEPAGETTQEPAGETAPEPAAASPNPAAAAPEPTVGPVEPAPVPVDVAPDAVVTDVLAGLEAAIEAEDLAGIRQVWTGITSRQSSGFEGLFASVRDLAVTFDVRSVHRQGSTIVAEVDSRYEFYALANRRVERSEASQVFQIEQRGGVWVIVGSTP